MRQPGIKVHATAMEVTAVTATFRDVGTLGRFLPCLQLDMLDLLDAIATAIREMATVAQTDLMTVCVTKYVGAYTQHRAVIFTNICGKITHGGSRHCYRDTVAPFVQTIENGFGTFRGLFGMKCNFLLCGSNKCTLFRGATKSSDVSDMMAHSFWPENISHVNVHMLCATFRLGKPICGVKNTLLMHSILNHSKWQAETVMQSEEKAYMTSFRLKKFNKPWMQSIIPGKSAKSILLNINFKGSVNVFLAVDSETEFREGIESDFMPLLLYVQQMLDKAT